MQRASTPSAVALLALLGSFAAGPAAAQVIPPGNEDVLAAMLGRGARLPGDCAFAGGEVDRTVVHARFQCPGGEVRVDLTHAGSGTPHAITTAQFTLDVIDGTPPPGFVAALEASVRANEAGVQWSRSGIRPAARAAFASLLVGLGLLAGVSGWRAAGRPTSLRVAIESLVVAAVVAMSLQADALPPAHGDTAIDVVLARECIASLGTACGGHSASALGLVQGQSFTYALAAWLRAGLSMRALAVLAACAHGAATGVLHHANARRFGGVAWVASAFVGGLGAEIAGHPIMWNPTWFPLPLAIAFVCTLAVTRGRSLWSAFAAGVALAFTTETHVLFGTLVPIVAALVFLTVERWMATASVLLAAFVLVELAVSPASAAANAIALREWFDLHRAVAALGAGAAVVAIATLPRFRRHLVHRDRAIREGLVVGAWLFTGLVAIGLVLPWAASRPPQQRYLGAALPAIAWVVCWFCDTATLRTRGAAAWIVSLLVFATAFGVRAAGHQPPTRRWLMDDAPAVADAAGIVDTSALDLELMVRTLPPSSLPEAMAAFVGTPGPPVFPPRQVRAVLDANAIDPPAGWRRIVVPHGDVLVGDVAAWAHPEAAEMCPEPRHGETCIQLAPADFEAVAASENGTLDRVFGLRIDRSRTAIAAWAEHGVRSLVWRIPLRPLGTDARREIVLRESPAEAIVAVDGTAWTPHGAHRALVERPTAPAFLTVRTAIEDRFEVGLPPLPLELTEPEVAAFGAALPPGS